MAHTSAVPTRDEAIAAVLDACDGHIGRVIEQQPTSDRPKVRVVFRPPQEPPGPSVKKERRLCWRCWAESYVVPQDSRRRFCDDCMIYRSRVAQAPDWKAARPEVRELDCPFCGQRIDMDDHSDGVFHQTGCPEFGRNVSGADFLRKVARSLGSRS